MESSSLVQARTPKRLKSEANEILDKLGLNMSTYINMALNQLVIQGGIPFAIKIKPYTNEDIINEVEGTLRLEGLDLSLQDLDDLRNYQLGEISGDDLRARIIKEATTR
jgi:addiction module RelB/DinJ family antitoxin